MMLLRPAIGFFSWAAYSFLQRSALDRGTYAEMRLLAAIRKTTNSQRDTASSSESALPVTSEIPAIASKLKEVSSIPDSWVCLVGDENDAVHENIRMSSKIACCYKEDGSAVALYGPAEHNSKSPSLRKLVSQRTNKLRMVEDIFERIHWNRHLDDVVPPTNAKLATDLMLNSKYRFCYRDYVNNEEMQALMCRRGGIENLLMRIDETGILEVDSAKKCTLEDCGYLLGFIPVEIIWDGQIEDSAIQWTTSCLRIGWKKLRKTVDRPPAAEKLRKDPWLILFPADEIDTGDILVMNRIGQGKLVYAKDSCLKRERSLF